MPGKRAIFTPLSILFRPLHKAEEQAILKDSTNSALWWRRRVPPPGPMGLFHSPFITIAYTR